MHLAKTQPLSLPLSRKPDGTLSWPSSRCSRAADLAAGSRRAADVRRPSFRGGCRALWRNGHLSTAAGRELKIEYMACLTRGRVAVTSKQAPAFLLAPVPICFCTCPPACLPACLPACRSPAMRLAACSSSFAADPPQHQAPEGETEYRLQHRAHCPGCSWCSRCWPAAAMAVAAAARHAAWRPPPAAPLRCTTFWMEAAWSRS